MIRHHRTATVLLALALAGPAAAAVPAPHPDVADFAALPTPLPLPYDPTADADPAAVAAKVARAKNEAQREGKLLLIDMGGNWCPDCRILAGTMRLPAVARFVAAHYVAVTVDSGRHMQDNVALARHYGVDHVAGVPSVFIVDPATNQLVDGGHTAALSDARHMSPQGLADWLAQWPSR